MSVIRCRSRWRLAWLAGALVLAVPLAAACGGSGSAGPAASPGQRLYEQAVVYSRCMRSHHVADFPIPAKGPGGTLVYPVRPPSRMLSSAHYDAFCGSIEQARLRAEQALTVSPAPSYLEWAYHGTIRFLCGDYGGALEACDRANSVVRILPAWRTATLFYLGELEKAREEAQRFVNGLRSFWVGPSVPTDEAVVRWVMQAHPISVSARRETLRRGLLGAGLPVGDVVQH